MVSQGNKGRMMRLLLAYFAIAGTASITFSLVIARIAASEGVRLPFVIATSSVLALVWPLTVPMLAFASVAAAELIRVALRKKVAPAAASASVSAAVAKV